MNGSSSRTLLPQYGGGCCSLYRDMGNGWNWMLGKEIDVWDFDEGATKIRRFLHPRKVLIVLDDVNHSDQLDYLAGKEDWYGFGSVVIITTRDAHLLVKHGVVRRSEVQF
ncbi:hypothetical protein ACLB2K_007760 [Fragaria x ananassa]